MVDYIGNLLGMSFKSGNNLYLTNKHNQYALEYTLLNRDFFVFEEK